MTSSSATGDGAQVLAASRFEGDEGDADPELAAGLAAYQQDRSRYGEALARLCLLRLLVPVVTVAAEEATDATGRGPEDSTEMAAVLLRGHDGRTGLLAFTGLAALSTWDPQARPVPVMAADAARAARHDGASALVVDVAGPVRFVVEGEDLELLAGGHRLVRAGTGHAWIRLSHD